MASRRFRQHLLTSTAIWVRSTSTTPLAMHLDLIGLVGVQFDNGAAASRITWWMGMVVVPRTIMKSTVTLSTVGTSGPPHGTKHLARDHHVMVIQCLMPGKTSI
jgi:hypothetical protein